MRTIFPTSHHWGPGQAEVRDGRVIAVGPHPDNPDPSRINENIADGIYHRSRVLRPAIRKGFLENGPGSTVDQRGQEPYLEVEWDKALEIVATELGRVKDRYGQPITREQGAAPNRFVRITDEISLTRSTHQIAVSKSSGR